MGKHSVIKSLHLDSEENPLDHQMDYMVMDENNREVARFLFKEPAQQLVTAVNYHDRLVEMVTALAYDYHLATGGDHHKAAHELLEELRRS